MSSSGEEPSGRALRRCSSLGGVLMVRGADSGGPGGRHVRGTCPARPPCGDGPPMTRPEVYSDIWIPLQKGLGGRWTVSGTLLLQGALLLLLLVVISPAGADLGVYSDSEDQRLTIRISPLPTDSGFPYALYRQVQLRCVIDTEPAIDIGSSGWRFNRDHHLLENNNKYTLYARPARGIVHSLTMVLTINGITKHELGDYTCEGQNSAGLRKSATIVLELIDEDTVGIRDPSYTTPTTVLLDDVVGTNSVMTEVTTRIYVTTRSTTSSSTSLTQKCYLSSNCVLLIILITIYLVVRKGNTLSSWI